MTDSEYKIKTTLHKLGIINFCNLWFHLYRPQQPTSSCRTPPRVSWPPHLIQLGQPEFEYRLEPAKNVGESREIVGCSNPLSPLTFNSPEPEVIFKISGHVLIHH